MVEIVNGKPTRSLAELRLCREGSVDKFLWNTLLFEMNYGRDGDGVLGARSVMNGAAADSKSVAAPVINNAIAPGTAAAGSTNAFPTGPRISPSTWLTSQVDLPLTRLRHHRGERYIPARPALDGAS
jgi:hypothetical protein